MMRSLASLVVALAVASTLQAQTVYLYNGSFSVGTGAYGDPSDWDGQEIVADTGIGIWRDLVDFHSAPASLGVLRIKDGNGGSYNQVFRTTDRLPAAKGATFTCDAWVKIDSVRGGIMQLVAHFSCGQYWTECASGGWVTLASSQTLTPGGGWTQVSGTGTVPAAANWGLFRIWTSGQIAYHVDDIRINGQNEVVSVFTGERHAIPGSASAVSGSDHANVYSPSGQLVAKTTVSGVSRLPAGCYVVKAGQQKVTQVQTGR
jgi:hypothetical protein